jgi:hypothetical protein
VSGPSWGSKERITLNSAFETEPSEVAIGDFEVVSCQAGWVSGLTKKPSTQMPHEEHKHARHTQQTVSER